MKCPKCAYLRQTRDDAFAPPTECPACGIVYAKYEPGGTEAAENPQSSPPPVKKPSAVDESTLRKARERVERRLRKKTGAGAAEDDQRERTLKRARILAAEGVRKRQQEWQHKQTTETTEAAFSQTSLNEEVDSALQETGGPSAISDLADRLVFVPVAGGTEQQTSSFVEDTLRPTAKLPSSSEPELELEIDDTISEAPLVVDTPAPQQATTAPEPEPPSQMPNEEEPALEESKVIAIGPRSIHSNESLAEDSAESDLVDDQPAMQIEADRPYPKAKIGGLMRFFQAVAWLILVAGVGGAVLSWITLTDVQAGTQALGPMNANNLSMALLLGFAYLAIGVLGFAFFWVTSLIGGQLAEIRVILLRGSKRA
ncbi:MAG: hypothetical protein HZB87_11675 [Desulfatitalea sp.]|nr:hypothetical protein [Desulfatitalea sp.]